MKTVDICAKKIYSKAKRKNKRKNKRKMKHYKY